MDTDEMVADFEQVHVLLTWAKNYRLDALHRSLTSPIQNNITNAVSLRLP